MSEKKATLKLDDKEYVLDTLVGTEGERAVDVRNLREASGYITFDDGYANTGACESKVTFIDGEKGILRYRGYSIEDLAARSTFIETAYLLIYGDLPTAAQLKAFKDRILDNAQIHEGLRIAMSGFPSTAHPMAVLSATLNTLGCYYPELGTNERAHDLAQLDEAGAVLISKVRTLAALAHRSKEGLPPVYPKPGNDYCSNFLHLMFSQPNADTTVHPEVARALDLILLLHADHEQNCSTSTVRMVASGGANLFASVSAGVCALWGPLHGGANQAVIEMLEEIHKSGDDGSRFIEAAKQKGSGVRLMGFGHRVYKNYDPRAKIIKAQCDKVLKVLGINDPLLAIAMRLEEAALNDPYFKQRNLYPNVDFYSGIILKAIGIPTEMFTVIFAIGRMPGWISHWKEIAESPKQKIHRPRQVYIGHTQRDYVPIEKR
ncbi:MAG: citrate synthase [Opitutales bacterium]|jgi:citrate synthase